MPALTVQTPSGPAELLCPDCLLAYETAVEVRLGDLPEIRNATHVLPLTDGTNVALCGLHVAWHRDYEAEQLVGLTRFADPVPTTSYGSTSFEAVAA